MAEALPSIREVVGFSVGNGLAFRLLGRDPAGGFGDGLVSLIISLRRGFGGVVVATGSAGARPSSSREGVGDVDEGPPSRLGSRWGGGGRAGSFEDDFACRGFRDRLAT
jgi:hypothetical protein